MVLDGCGHSGPNEPPSSGHGSGRSSGIPHSWMMECQGSTDPYDQQRYHSLMQTTPLDAQWLVRDLCVENR